MKFFTAIKARSNGFRGLWHRTKRALAAFVSCSVASAMAGCVIGAASSYVLDVAYGFTPSFDNVVYGVVHGTLLGGFFGAISGIFVVIIGDEDDLLVIACWLLALSGVMISLISLGVTIGVAIPFFLIITAIAFFVGALFYRD